MKPHKISTHLAFSDNCYFHSFFISCLIELKFCEVSRNSISNWTWKFQLSILKNKKVLFLKKIFFWPLSIWKQKIFVNWLNFLEGFGVARKSLKERTYVDIFFISLVALGCGGSASENNTYIVQASATAVTSPCTYTVCKCSTNICRIRYDFTVNIFSFFLKKNL